MSLQVILVRPGSTLYDEELRVQGILDLPLCERGIEEASLMARELSSLGLSAIYSGPSQNATQTANLIAESSGLIFVLMVAGVVRNGTKKRSRTQTACGDRQYLRPGVDKPVD